MTGGGPPRINSGTTGFDVAPIREQIGREARVHSNVAQDILQVSASDVKLRLRDFESAIRKRAGWQGPAGFALGFFANLLTLTGLPSGTLFGMSYDRWIGINVTLLLVSGFFMAKAILGAFVARKGNEVDDVVHDLMSPAAAAVLVAPATAASLPAKPQDL